MLENYDNWLDEFFGLKPHSIKHPHSFNNIVFSTELILAKDRLGILSKYDISNYLGHVRLMEDEHGLYAPKNSHDNITAKIAGLVLLKSNRLYGMDIDEACKGKHPRDKILFPFYVQRSWYNWVLLPLALADIVRAILDSGKVRPKWWEKEHFLFRLKAKLGLLDLVEESKTFGGRKEIYKYKGRDRVIRYLQNDGKIINLLRLSVLKHEPLLKPFVRFCKKLYIKEMGEDFQSQLFANYFEEEDHPVRVAYAELDSQGITVIDC
jgi:hypothetical protein